MNNKIIGIIGGMGPEATANFYMNLIKATKVNADQDHFRVIIDSNSKIPDRTKAILGIGDSPVPEMINTARNLEKAGVELGCIPCITAHYFIEHIETSVNYPIINALKELDFYIKSNYIGANKVGVLATSGTIKSELFNKYLKDYNVIYPSETVQKNKVMNAIYSDEIGIKSGKDVKDAKKLLVEAGEYLIEKGAQILIAGCTEIVLAIKPEDFHVPLIDPMEVVIKKIIKWFANILLKKNNYIWTIFKLC